MSLVSEMAEIAKNLLRLVDGDSLEIATHGEVHHFERLVGGLIVWYVSEAELT